MGETAVSVVLGAGVGALVTLVLWKAVVSRQLDAQFEAAGRDLLTSGRRSFEQELTQTIQAEVPPAVERQIYRTMQSYGITPTTGHQLAALLDRADAMGLI